MEGSLNFFCTCVSQSCFGFLWPFLHGTQLFSRVKSRFCGGFLQYLSRVSWVCLEQMVVASEKVLLFQKHSLEGSCNCPLHLSPSLLLTSVLGELSTPLRLHYSENHQSCRPCWGMIWASFFGPAFSEAKFQSNVTRC